MYWSWFLKHLEKCLILHVAYREFHINISNTHCSKRVQIQICNSITYNSWTKRCFVPSFVEIGRGVSKKMKKRMWKDNILIHVVRHGNRELAWTLSSGELIKHIEKQISSINRLPLQSPWNSCSLFSTFANLEFSAAIFSWSMFSSQPIQNTFYNRNRIILSRTCY